MLFFNRISITIFLLALIPSVSFSLPPVNIVTLQHGEIVQYDASEGYFRKVDSAIFNYDGTRIYTESPNGRHGFWDLKGNHLDNLHGILGSLSPDATKIASIENDHTISISDSSNLNLLLTLPGNNSIVNSVSFSPDSNKIVIASDNDATVWDIVNGNLLLNLNGHNHDVTSGSFSPDGTKIITSSSDNTVIMWDALSGNRLYVLPAHNDNVYAASFSPDGTKFVTASADQTAKVWDTVTGNLIHTLQAHNAWIISASFSPDGTKIITASGDSTVKIWETLSGNLIHTLRGHTDQINSACFSADGKKILTASNDGNAKLWLLPPNIESLRWLTLKTLLENYLASLGNDVPSYESFKAHSQIHDNITKDMLYSEEIAAYVRPLLNIPQ